MAEAELTIIDLDAPAKKAPKKRPAKKAKAAPKKAQPNKTAQAEDGLTIVDLDPEPGPSVEPGPDVVFGPDDVPPGLRAEDGQHVNPRAALVGVVIDPPMEAWRLQRRGKPWFEIAELTGYPTGADAQTAVESLHRRAAAEQGPANRAMALQLAVARHERVLDIYWDKMEAFDLGAAAVISRELAQLDKVQRVGEIDAQAGQHGPRIVIAGNEADYVAGLMEVFAEQHAPKALPPARNETIDG